MASGAGARTWARAGRRPLAPRAAQECCTSMTGSALWDGEPPLPSPVVKGSQAASSGSLPQGRDVSAAWESPGHDAGPGLGGPAAELLLVPVHRQTAEVWRPRDGAVAVPVEAALWAEPAFPRHRTRRPAWSATIHLPPHPRLPFRPSGGAFRHTPARMPAVQEPWLRAIHDRRCRPVRVPGGLIRWVRRIRRDRGESYRPPGVQAGPRSTPRQGLIAEDADEVLLAHDVELPAGGAPPEHHLAREARRTNDPGLAQGLGNSRPRADVQAVAGGLVAEPVDRPPPELIEHSPLLWAALTCAVV